MLVDTVATSHIVTKDVLKRVDGNFNQAKHYMELADGARRNNVALKRGEPEVSIANEIENIYVKALLKDALLTFIPTYPQDIFSVRAATSNEAKVKFSQDKMNLTTKMV